MEMVVVAPPAPGTLEDLRRRFFATPLQALLSLVSLAIMVLLAWKLLNWAIFS
ncbi:amino acid ABC transporter permease, partial [Mesorhizobium sp. M2E.F.Ca.ET.154.01.1.1]